MHEEMAHLDVVHHEEKPVVGLEREPQRHEVGVAQGAHHVPLAHSVRDLHAQPAYNVRICFVEMLQCADLIPPPAFVVSRSSCSVRTTPLGVGVILGWS